MYLFNDEPQRDNLRSFQVVMFSWLYITNNIISNKSKIKNAHIDITTKQKENETS